MREGSTSKVATWPGEPRGLGGTFSFSAVEEMAKVFDEVLKKTISNQSAE